jgi:hypothetical protein
MVSIFCQTGSTKAVGLALITSFEGVIHSGEE